MTEESGFVTYAREWLAQHGIVPTELHHRFVDKKGCTSHLYKVKAGGKTLRYCARISADGDLEGLLAISSKDRRVISDTGSVERALQRKQQVAQQKAAGTWTETIPDAKRRRRKAP